MVLYLIGLGLGDVEDITVKGLNTVKRCAKVYLEAYTSMLCYGLDKTQLEVFYGRPLIEADRQFVEERCDEMFDAAADSEVALLVVGDPFGATTHSDLVLRAKRRNIDVRVIHNASIMNAVGFCGLQLYSFGVTVSLVMWTDGWQPDSYYDKILMNRRNGMHTLCLLDIKTREQTVENLMKGRKVYEPPRYMSCSEAARQLLTIIERRRVSVSERNCGDANGLGDSCATGAPLGYFNNFKKYVRHGRTVPVIKRNPILKECRKDTMVVGLARVGWSTQKVVYCTLEEMTKVDLGPPLHALIIPGKTHEVEAEMLDTFRIR